MEDEDDKEPAPSGRDHAASIAFYERILGGYDGAVTLWSSE